jgi:hypothetical protein
VTTPEATEPEINEPATPEKVRPIASTGHDAAWPPPQCGALPEPTLCRYRTGRAPALRVSGLVPWLCRRSPGDADWTGRTTDRARRTVSQRRHGQVIDETIAGIALAKEQCRSDEQIAITVDRPAPPRRLAPDARCPAGEPVTARPPRPRGATAMRRHRQVPQPRGGAHACRQIRGKSAGRRKTGEDTVRCRKERSPAQTAILRETAGGRAGRIHLAKVTVDCGRRCDTAWLIPEEAPEGGTPSWLLSAYRTGRILQAAFRTVGPARPGVRPAPPRATTRLTGWEPDS